MLENYNLLIRTGEAEIRAVEQVHPNILKYIFPIIEITRGRKRTIDGTTCYPFDNRLEKLKKTFKGKRVGIALTNELLLSSKEINNLTNPNEGYKNWVEFLLEIKQEEIFEEIVPVIAINAKDDDYENNFLTQVQELKKHFNSLIYRSPIVDEYCYDDLDIIKEELSSLNFSILIDCGYAPQASHNNVAEKVISRISNMKKLLTKNKNINYIVTSTSFPNNVSEMGGGDHDTYLISSVSIYEYIAKQISDIQYGDYGAINPIRNDQVTMARGWIPRIDVPLQKEVYYYRQRRAKGITAYATTYTIVANQAVNDPRFPKELRNTNWGITQIINCSLGGAPGSSPGFWISVRMNIHIEQQVRRISFKVKEN